MLEVWPTNTHEMKPMEVEILVAEIGHAEDGSEDQLFHILYDGTVMDEDMSVVLGGKTDTISDRFGDFDSSPTLKEGLQRAVAALAGDERDLAADDLEVAVLERATERRAFRRLSDSEISSLLV